MTQESVGFHDDEPASAMSPRETTRRKTPPLVPLERLGAAIDRGVAFLRGKQLPTGAWLAPEYFEPQTSACHLLTLAFLDRLPLVEARAYARFLATLQRDDGSFPAYPHADRGDLAATALVYAALDTVNLAEHAVARSRALAYVEENGGFAGVTKLVASGDLTAVYLAMAGHVDPFALPDPELSFILAPPLLDKLLTRVNAGVVATIVFMGAVTRHLRERVRPSPPHVRKLHEIENARCADFIESWMNPNGNYCGTTCQTTMVIGTLFALGRSPESPRLHSAICWFNKHRIWDERGLHLRAFTNENWMTAWSLRALLRAGVDRTDPAVENGLDYLCWSQSKLPMPEVNLRRKNAHRTGAWGFQEDNFVLVDMDDTGIILSALGLARQRPASSPALESARSQRVQDAIDLALQNVLDMQNDDGGWAGFVWNLGSKSKGPLFDRPLALPSTLAERIRFFSEAPIELGEPAVEGLTGRVLQGLGANGFGPASPEVQRAARFLEERQNDDGSFWARWIIGYRAATASVISGLAACGWDLETPWVQRAVAYLLAKQNDDGGWGETPAAYERPHEDIASPSMPPLTAIVLCALVDAGLGESPAAQRAATYLLATQNQDGSWPTNGWLQIYLPSTSYYLFEGEAWYRPIEALAKLRGARGAKPEPRREEHRRPLPAPRPLGELAARRVKATTWTTTALRETRWYGDPDADTVIGELLAASLPIGEVMAALTHTKDLLPRELPAPVRAFFDSSSAFPDWADPKLIRRGQELFTRHGWMMSAGLFCSSLPQAYCAANGAGVLTQTQAMTRKVRSRILETAQFLFDICEEGSLGENGKGIYAAQRVRMVHALIRYFIRSKGEWDEQALGIPINQEDLAGTLMTFSVVLLDALATAGITTTRDDEEAFLHLWKVAGHFLGIAPALMPVDVVDARAMMQTIRDDQWASSAQGRLLAAELISSMREYLPSKLLNDLPAVLIRFFAPPPAPKLLGIDSEGSLDRLFDAGMKLGSVFGLAASDESRKNMVRRFSRDLMMGLISAQRAEKRPRFQIPSALVRGWKLT